MELFLKFLFIFVVPSKKNCFVFIRLKLSSEKALCGRKNMHANHRATIYITKAIACGLKIFKKIISRPSRRTIYPPRRIKHMRTIFLPGRYDRFDRI